MPYVLIFTDYVYAKRQSNPSTPLSSASQWVSAAKPMFGCPDYNDSRRSYVSFLSDNKFASLDDAAALVADSSSLPAGGSGDSTEQGGGRGGDKKRTNGKQLVRKKWNGIRDQVDILLRALDSGDDKPALVDVSRILHEASTAESLIENPGETFVSSLNTDLNELAQV